MLPPANADGSMATALSAKMNIVPARIVGITTEIDLALLKIDGLKLPALTLATYSQVRQGETVFAFGSPSGLRNTLTHGLISSVATPAGSRFAAHLHPDRRADQPGQLRRSAGQHPRRGRRRQHVHHLAVGRQRRAGLRDSERHGPDRVPPAEAVRPVAAAGSGHEPADDHAGHGGRRWAWRATHGVIVSDVWPQRSRRGRGPEAGRHPACRSTASRPTTCRRVELQLPPPRLDRERCSWWCCAARRS